MDIRWLIGLFFGVNFLCGTSFAKTSVLSIPKDLIGHGTQYRFQYYVRNEHGDYKTQEEAGIGGIKAQGSYAVEEPNGDLRIIQYTAGVGEGFKAHIRINHGDKATSRSEEINIPAEEMVKLIKNNRKNDLTEVQTEKVDELSESYVLGPPKNISDIVMEQAAAIREIISREIEAEKKREADEKLKIEKPRETENKSVSSIPESLKNIDEEKPLEKNNDEEISVPKKAEISSTQNSDSNISESGTVKGTKIDEKNGESLAVRVALTPRNVENSDKTKDDDKRATRGEKQSEILGEGPVRNFDAEDRLMFYKPTKKKLNQNHQKIVSNDDLKGNLRTREAEVNKKN